MTSIHRSNRKWRRTARSRRRTAIRHGLTAVEVLLSTLLVGIVLVGSLECLQAALRGRMANEGCARSEFLAQQLMVEILNDDYEDPTDAVTFGPESGEPAGGAGPRSGYDDVDDYHAWSQTPPQDRAGNDLVGFQDFQRDVTVEWVDPSNPANTTGSDQGTKRITVSVLHYGVVKAQLTALRTNSD